MACTEAIPLQCPRYQPGNQLGSSDSITSAEVDALRTRMDVLSKEHPFDLVLNMHAQSDDKISYYIHTEESTNAAYHARAMRLAYLTTDDNPYFFPEDMFYSSPAPRYVEGWM